jgi:hypothetical protein
MNTQTNKLVNTLGYTFLLSVMISVMVGLVDMGLEYSLYNKLSTQIKSKGVDLKVNRAFDMQIKRGTENSKAANGSTHASAWYSSSARSLNIGWNIENFMDSTNLHEMVHAWDDAYGKDQYWSSQYFSDAEKAIATAHGDSYAEQEVELLACFVTDGVDSKTTKAFWVKVGNHPWQTWSHINPMYRILSRTLAFCCALLLIVVIAVRFINKLRGRI